MPSRFSRRLASLALAFATLAPQTLFAQNRPNESPAATAPVCTGDFEYAGGDNERSARDAAIDAVVDDMSFFVRGIARSRLQRATPIPAKVSIRQDGDQLVMVIDGRRYSSPANGAAVDTTGPGGDKLKLTQRLRNGRIEQTFRGKDGGRTNLYRCGDGKMVMSVTVFSPKLPHSVKYKLTYRAISR